VAIHHHNIPAKYQNIIWEAMQPPPQTDEVRDELVAAFDIPPSISAKPGKTSGGITGLTYGHMKAWSKNLKLDVYDNLFRTWNSMEAPDWWKWRWLCPIPKNTDDNCLAGQRSKILEEVATKPG